MLVIVFSVCFFAFLSLPSSLSFDLVSEAIFFAITIIILNKLIERQRLQKNQRSMEFVRRKVLSVCDDLIFRMKPPEDWRKRFAKRSNWKNFFKKTLRVRDEALNMLENILDRHSYLLEAELRNDVFDLVSSLESFIWLHIESFIEKSSTNSKELAFVLSDTASQITLVMVQASKMIKQHKLIKGEYKAVSSRDGSPPSAVVTFQATEGFLERQYQLHKRILEDAIEFRDQCRKLVFQKNNRHA